ncbi:MAG: hydroxyacid dehydrogenase, partial [Planctomycetales bacterium]|nr:hydroxyacid dehydrogenase [Planctomycetales bacterium]
DALNRVDAILCGNDLIVNAEVLDKAPRVKAIAKLGAGLDTIDIDAATLNGVIVFHTPGANNQAVADHTFALILGVARNLVYCDRSLREKRWEHTKIMGLEIWQKTLGLIGLGAIGRCVALRAQGFQMKVVAHDPFWPAEFAAQHGIEKMEIDALLKIADIISIHAPLTAGNKGLIDKRALSLMKPSALLINAARGGIVDEVDLCEALKNRVIAGAGIDVFEHEPPADSPLLELDNVVLTPHTAAFTFEGLNNMSTGVVQQLVEYHKGNKPRFTVNPEVWDKQKP